MTSQFVLNQRVSSIYTLQTFAKNLKQNRTRVGGWMHFI